MRQLELFSCDVNVEDGGRGGGEEGVRLLVLKGISCLLSV